MSALSTPLYRLLEGYTWPAGLRRRGIERARMRRQSIERRLKEVAGLDRALMLERPATYLSAGLGAAACVTAVVAPQGPDAGVLAIGIGSLILVPIWYRSAASSSTYWDATVRALVNVGRVPLATALGLQLPVSVEQERRMWELVVAFDYYGFNARWADRLIEFRVGAEAASNAVAGDPLPGSDSELGEGT